MWEREVVLGEQTRSRGYPCSQLGAEVPVLEYCCLLCFWLCHFSVSERTVTCFRNVPPSFACLQREPPRCVPVKAVRRDLRVFGSNALAKEGNDSTRYLLRRCSCYRAVIERGAFDCSWWPMVAIY